MATNYKITDNFPLNYYSDDWDSFTYHYCGENNQQLRAQYKGSEIKQRQDREFFRLITEEEGPILTFGPKHHDPSPPKYTPYIPPYRRDYKTVSTHFLHYMLENDSDEEEPIESYSHEDLIDTLYPDTSCPKDVETTQSNYQPTPLHTQNTEYLQYLINGEIEDHSCYVQPEILPSDHEPSNDNESTSNDSNEDSEIITDNFFQPLSLQYWTRQAIPLRASLKLWWRSRKIFKQFGFDKPSYFRPKLHWCFQKPVFTRTSDDSDNNS